MSNGRSGYVAEQAKSGSALVFRGVKHVSPDSLSGRDVPLSYPASMIDVFPGAES